MLTPKNETTTLTVRFQNLSIGKTDTAVLAFRRGEGFENDPDEVKTFGLVPGVLPPHQVPLTAEQLASVHPGP